MQNTLIKIVKLSEEEYTFLKVCLLFADSYGNLDDSGKTQMKALLSKLDSAVVESDQSEPPEQTAANLDFGKP